MSKDISSKNNNKKQQKINYKRIIMPTLILLALITFVVAYYVTTYNQNKMTVDKAFDFNENDDPEIRGLVRKSEKYFLNQFEEFDIEMTKCNDAYKDNGVLIAGSRSFKITSKKSESCTIEGNTVTLKMVLAADWINYHSRTYSGTFTIGTDKTASINNITQTFPAKATLFVKVKQPKLYVYVEWNELNEENKFYAFLEYSYNKYK